MKDILNKLLIAQDKANHFIYSLLLSLLFFILLVVANRIAEGNISLMGLASSAGGASFNVTTSPTSV